MQQHGPSSLDGPVSRQRGWWSAHQGGAPKKRARRDEGRPMRHDLIERVRREIADGTYDTPDKWEQALDRLADELDSE